MPAACNSFNEGPSNYDAFRPTYPDALFCDIIDYAALHPGAHALEIGIGTGQATKPILDAGCRVTAVELGDALCAFVCDKYREYANFEAICDDFLCAPLETGAFDLVYCATAFHWLPPEAGYRKIHALLKPRGTVALFWNHPYPNRENDPGNAASKTVYEKYYPSTAARPEFTEADCQKRVSELEHYGFADIEYRLYHRARTLSVDAYIQLLNTYSDHRALEPDIRARFEEDMRIALEAVGGSIHIYDTIDLYMARKPPLPIF